MLKCNDCGTVFDDEESHTWTEPHKERWSGCLCGGDCVEVIKCKMCEEYFDEDKLCEGICPKCGIETEETLNEYLSYFNGFQINYLRERELIK